MRALSSIIAPVALLAAASPAPAQDAAILSLVDRFEAARRQFDPVALAATLAPDYEEISPVGTVDPRAAVLGFYAPAARRPAPAMTADETVVRARGDLALVTRRQSIALPGGTTRSLRVRYVARRGGGGWQLVSVQYTPIPPARAG
jgi:ketosteroid isomerase-like protein